MRKLIFVLMLCCTSKLMASNVNLDFYKMHYFFNEDKTYTLTVTERMKVLTNFGARSAQKRPVTYYPDTEEFKLVQAYVLKANGKKIQVKPDQIFTRTAADDSNAPGFNTRMTTTVVYPNLTPKDSTYISYQIIHKKPPQMGFSTALTPLYGMEQHKQVVVLNLPKAMKMRWIKSGRFRVSDKLYKRRRVVIATLKHQNEVFTENNMADLGNNLPYFLASDAQSWQQIGQQFWQLSKDKIEPTAEITALAEKLTEGKKGLEAARAIHNWVAKNIHYIAVYLNEGAGVEPHTASQVLANGYGDCKDNTVLTIALLKASGITAYPVLVNVGTNFYKYPLATASQFNHAMVYIPELKAFANPTSEYESFGELDSYTSNKFALICGPKTILTQTPAGTPEVSHYSSHKKIAINEHGNVTGKVQIELDGRANQNSRRLFNGAILKLVALRVLEENEGGVGTITTSDPTDLDHNMTIKADWKSPEVFTVGNESYFEIPQGMEFKSLRNIARMIQVETRRYPTMIGASKVNWDYEISLPKEFRLVHLPKNSHFVNSAGRYDSEYFEQDQKLFVHRKFVVNKDVYSPKEYPALKELLYQPLKDARSVVSMRRNLK